MPTMAWTVSFLLFLKILTERTSFAFVIVSCTSTYKRSRQRADSPRSLFPINSLDVFDNVFSSQACLEVLHPLAVDHAERCISSVFCRTKGIVEGTTIATSATTTTTTTTTQSTVESGPGQQSQQQWLTPLEIIIDRLLDAIDDIDSDDNDKKETCNIVEYWSRQDHIAMDVHCDIDEARLEQQGTLRYPKYSHVLYLQISLPGPTCVFLSPCAMDDCKGNEENAVGNNNIPEMKAWSHHEPILLATVPAVQGRLLRFPGHWFHAVPKPHDQWLQEAAEKGESEYKQEDHFHDNLDIDDDCMRSVLLFNTWEHPGPLGVGPDVLKPSIPLGISLDDDHDVLTFLAQEQETLVSEWQMDYGGVDFDHLHCNPRPEWVANNVLVEDSEDGNGKNNNIDDHHAMSTSEIPLKFLGNEVRRLNMKPQIKILASASGLKEALEQDQHVSVLKFQLRQ